MTYTVAQVIADIRSQESKITDQQAMTYIQAVHRFLCANFVLKTQSFDISLVANQAAYTLDTSITSVRTAVYQSSASTVESLEPGSTIDWDVELPSWRHEPSEIPSQFSVEEGQITLFPKPPTATTSGYPKLVVTAAVRPTLTKDSNIPWDVPPDVYIEGAKAHWAKNNCPELIELFWASYENELESFRTQLPWLSLHYRKQITPDDRAFGRVI